MLDIKFLRENPEVVKQNIRNKFQDQKLELVDKVIELDKENRDIKQEVEALRAKRNKISKQIGALMGQGKREEAEEVKKQVAVDGSRIEALSAREKEVEEEIKKIMMVIPNIIDPSVPIGKDDSENVEAERFGEPVVPDFEIPYHTDIMESFDGIDLDNDKRSCRKRILLSDGRHCTPPLCHPFLCKRFHDRPRIYLLRTAFHDPRQRRKRCYELR